MKTVKEVVQNLKSETKSNPAASAVFHLLAMRKRNRSSITLPALKQRMKAEGFNYSPTQYRSVLNAMCKSGVGTPVVSNRGNCVGIKDINVSLTELGSAILEGTETLKPIKSSTVRSIERTLGIKINPITSLEVSINGKPAVLHFENGLTAKELAAFVSKIQNS